MANCDDILSIEISLHNTRKGDGATLQSLLRRTSFAEETPDATVKKTWNSAMMPSAHVISLVSRSVFHTPFQTPSSTSFLNGKKRLRREDTTV